MRYKIKQALILAAAGMFFYKAYTQQPEKMVNSWAEKSPIEKIYFHFDRNDYMAGQTIWFKGYLYSDFVPADKVTTLFVELLNTSSSVISRQVLPVFGGFSRGQIELPDTLTGGFYILRAYTATMLNHDPGFLHEKNFFIFGRNKKENPVVVTETRATRIEFFPEGGNFITGLSNSIAYKATDENGLPVSVSGVIKKENGEKVTGFSSYHDGMGYFDMIAEEKNTYYAVLDNDPSGQKYYLPISTTKGVVLRIISIGQTKQFEILQRHDDPVFRAAYMVGHMQHHLVFKTELKEGKDEMTGTIQTSNLSSGILHITVFNKEGMPLAERLTFVDNKEYIQPGDILFDTLDFSDRGKNHFTLSLKDTVRGSFSVSVYDPAFDTRSKREQNIFSGLLLTSDLKGYIHDAAYYFSATGDSAQNAIDLVMMTNGWRRFKWSDIIKGTIPENKYADPGYITLAGKINMEGTNKPFADKELLTFIVTADSGKNMKMLHTNADGYFKLDSMIFFGNARILFSDIKGKKNKFIDVNPDGDSLHRHYPLPRVSSPDQFIASGSNTKIPESYNAILKAEGVMLEGVTIKSHKKTKLQELEDEYASGAFSGDANRTMDLTGEDLTPYRNILDYLQFRVPGLQIQLSTDGGGYRVTYRTQASASALSDAMIIYLNEVPSDPDVLSTIPARDVALIKVFSSLTAASGGGYGGVLAVYTKKGVDISADPLAGETINYKGYSVIKEFYSPDYRVNKNTKTDQRITLYWNPSVIVADVDPKIPFWFYNNDRTRQFKIVIEGMTTTGKMLMIEKTISGKKAF
ncbi:MAG TPA: hypothetical protein VIZ28_08445 [Chitinophagaceae bacterium]